MKFNNDEVKIEIEKNKMNNQGAFQPEKLVQKYRNYSGKNTLYCIGAMNITDYMYLCSQ